jgi:Asp-tRNA(Asn)/Glu-tRNA(Gln) amidotransferase B subunit
MVWCDRFGQPLAEISAQPEKISAQTEKKWLAQLARIEHVHVIARGEAVLGNVRKC